MKRAGTIWSVLILASGIGTATERRCSSGRMRQVLAVVDQAAVHCRGGSHSRVDEVGPNPRALAPHEVAVGGGDAALTGLPLVAVDRQAHRARRGISPLHPGIAKDAAQAFRLGLRADQTR